MPARARYGEMDVEKQGMMNKAVSVFDFIVGMVRNDKGMLAKFVEQLEDLGEQICMDIPLVSSYQKKQDDIEEFIGASQPESVDILPPHGFLPPSKLKASISSTTTSFPLSLLSLDSLLLLRKELLLAFSPIINAESVKVH